MVIRSGGQTGVDRAALHVAIALGLPYEGWCPRGGWAEDRPEPPGLLEEFPRLRETPSADPRERTAWNARDADATLILASTAALRASPGTELTRFFADATFEKPCRVADPADVSRVEDIAEWLEALNAERHAAPLVLNVAGPRESEWPGVYARARRFLEELFGRSPTLLR